MSTSGRRMIRTGVLGWAALLLPATPFAQAPAEPAPGLDQKSAITASQAVLGQAVGDHTLLDREGRLAIAGRGGRIVRRGFPLPCWAPRPVLGRVSACRWSRQGVCACPWVDFLLEAGGFGTTRARQAWRAAPCLALATDSESESGSDLAVQVLWGP